jgi:hypothetical protein
VVIPFNPEGVAVVERVGESGEDEAAGRGESPGGGVCEGEVVGLAQEDE